MSNIEEKLHHFNRIILEEAASRRDIIRNQLVQKKAVLIKKQNDAIDKEASQLLKKELISIAKEKNDILSKSFLESRQLLRKTREEIVSAILNELNIMVENFIGGNEYPSFLEKCIYTSIHNAGKGKITVLVSKKDMEKYSSLFDKISNLTDVIFDISKDEIMGGCLVYNKTTNVFIDNSILTRINSSKEDFFQTSCLRID